MNNERIDVLAVMREASGFALDRAYDLPSNAECEQAEALMVRINAASAAVAELMTKAEALLKVTDFDLLEWQDLNNALRRAQGEGA